MEEPRSRKFAMLSFFIAALSLIMFVDIKKIAENSFFKNRYMLIIGIFSAPENFEKRMSLRETWLRLTADLSVSYYFVVGKQLCAVHPLDRISPYSCEENMLSLPEDVTSETEFSTLTHKLQSLNTQEESKEGSIGFGFYALSDITIKKLGIMKHFLNYIEYVVTIKLISSDTKKTLASVTINKELSHENDSDFVLKGIEPLKLKQFSEAEVVMEFTYNNISLFPSCDYTEWNVKPGVINIVHLILTGHKKPWPFQMNSCSYVVMNYIISDMDSLKAHIEGKEKRKKEWHDSRKSLQLQLVNESNIYGDIEFVDMVDVYRNLPHKLIYFFKRLRDSESFNFILKTDDDSFIDISRVYKQLLAVSREINGHVKILDGVPYGGIFSNTEMSKLWCWGKFREFWRVQDTGKWREVKYRSPAYPSFPCGGGYVINNGVVDYLTLNAENLQYFQGEDVSIGIWLSGLNMVYFETPKVSSRSARIRNEDEREHSGSVKDQSNSLKSSTDVCEWTCDNVRSFDIPLCNKVQLEVSDVYYTWKDFKQNRYI